MATGLEKIHKVITIFLVGRNAEGLESACVEPALGPPHFPQNPSPDSPTFMKPKFRGFARTGLPVSIILAASSLLPVSAALINPDANGNVVVTVANGNANLGANSVTANGDTTTPIVASPYTVTIDPGVTLVGQAGGSIVNVTVAGYTVTNSGILDSSGTGNGIASSTVAVAVVNETTGIINGNGVSTSAINGGAGTSLTNRGTVSGQFHGLQIAGNSGTVTNAAGGIIRGNDTGAGTGNGIDVTSNLAASTNAGTISGVNGVRVTGNATLANTGTITGTAGDGINTGGVLTLTGNSGTITGSDDGIQATGTNSSVINNGSITGTAGDGVDLQTGATVTNNAGTIRGAQNGVLVTGDATSITNASGATITGTNANGVRVTGNLVSGTNAGTINGANGISTGGNATLANSGTITGTAGDGINTTGVLTLTGNSGTITGSDDGIQATGTNSSVINNGSITGTAGDGVDLQTGATVTNNAGTIRGAQNGVLVTGDATSITNASGATITGTAVNGVRVTGNLVSGTNAGTINGASGISIGGTGSLTNTGTIQGTAGDGVISGGALTLTNSGSILGTDNGVETGDNSVITNSGIIQGDNIGIVATGATGFTLNNTGDVVGVSGTAITGTAGVDNFNLNDGSRIFGNIDGGAGIDKLTFNGGLTSIYNQTDATENIIHSGVLNVEAIEKTGTGVAFIGDGGVDIDGDGLVDAPLQQITTDAITVNGGGLYINGDISPVTAALTEITNNATALGGTGTWDANVTLKSGAGFSPGAIPIGIADTFAAGGSTNPDDAIGSVTVSGNLTFETGSHYRVDSNPLGGTQTDQVNVGGVLTIQDGTQIRLSPTDVNTTMADGRVVIANAAGGIVGDISTAITGVQFNSNVPDTGDYLGSESGNSQGNINLNTVLGNYFTTYTIEGNNLVRTIDHQYSELPGLTRSESSLGDALEGQLTNPDVEVQDFLASIDYSDLGTAVEIMDALTPEEHLAVTSGIISGNYRLHRQVQTRMAGLRSMGDTIISSVETPAPTTSYIRDAKGGIVGTNQTSSTSTSFGSDSGGWNLWGAYSSDWQESDGEVGRLDADTEAGAVTVGLDYRFNDSFIVGGLVDASRSDYDSDSGSSDVDSMRFAIYGTFGQSTGWYSDFLAGYNTHEIDGRRSSVFGDLRSSNDAEGIQGMWTIGYTMGGDVVKHGPFAGVEYQKLDVDGFSENGGPLPVAVSIDDYDIESLRGLIGYRFDADMGSWRPYASVAYAHEFEDGDTTATARLGAPFDNVPFKIYGPEQGSSILVSIGTAIALGESLSLDLGYRGEFSVDDGANTNGGTVGLNWEF